MILSCRGDRYGHFDTLNVKIRPLFQILWAFPIEVKKSGKMSEEEEEEESVESYSYRRGCPMLGKINSEYKVRYPI